MILRLAITKPVPLSIRDPSRTLERPPGAGRVGRVGKGRERRTEMSTKKQKPAKMPGKAERMAIAKKNGWAELEVYLDLCKKFGRKPAASAVVRAKALKDAK